MGNSWLSRLRRRGYCRRHGVCPVPGGRCPLCVHHGLARGQRQRHPVYDLYLEMTAFVPVRNSADPLTGGIRLRVVRLPIKTFTSFGGQPPGPVPGTNIGGATPGPFRSGTTIPGGYTMPLWKWFVPEIAPVREPTYTLVWRLRD